jgi:cell division transport system ATP-binding protein
MTSEEEMIIQTPDYEDNSYEEEEKEKSEKSDKEIIRFQNLSYTYSSKTTALKGISLSINQGEFVFIVGESGSGKSTLIRTLLGELKPTEGDIIVEGANLKNIGRKEMPYYRRRLGVVFQEFKLLEDRNVYENVEIAQRVIGVKKDKRIENCNEMIKLVGLSDQSKKKVRELSGGEQQRVAIARAMVNKPSILLADEPTGNLDPNNSWEIMGLLQNLNEMGTTVVVVTHNDNLVNSMQKRVITLQTGEIIGDKLGGYIQ